MSIISRLLLASIGAVAFLLVPNFAGHAKADSFLFYYDKDDVGDIRAALTGSDTFDSTTGGLDNTTVYAKGFAGIDKPLPFTLSKDPGSVDKSTKTVKYETEYTCRNGKISYESLDFTKGDYAISLVAFVKLPSVPGDFNSQSNLDGEIRFVQADRNGGTTTSIGQVPTACLPSGLKQDNPKSVKFANYTKLSNKDAWPGVKGSAAVKTEQNAASNSPSGDDDPEAECTAPGFGWFVCGAIKYFKAFTEWVEDSVIGPLFETKPLTFDTTDTNPQYAAWNATRAIANVFFVLVFMGVIFGNLFGIEAYNIKKILPKLVVAAILIQASYFMMAAAIDITNILGRGLREILAGLTPPVEYKGGTLGGFITLGAAGLIAAALTAKIAAVGIIAGVLPLAIGLLAVLMTLVLRQTLIVLAILTAPIAIVSMVLPNTERFFRSWTNLFIKLLLMYPMIVFLFAAGRIAAYATLSNNTVLAPMSPIIAMLCMALPLLAVPFTFSWAGGIMQKVSSGVFKGGAKVQGGLDNQLKGRREETRRKAALNSNPNIKLRDTRLKWGEGIFAQGKTRWNNKVAGGGLFYNSVGAKRKMGEAQDKILSQDMKSYGRMFDSLMEGATPADKTRKLLDIFAGDAPEFKSKITRRTDDVAKRFAINRLAETRQIAQLREIHNDGDLSSGDRAIFSSVMSENFADMRKAAPDLVGGFGAIDTLGAAGLADLDHSTVSAYLDDQSVSAQVRAARAEHIGNLVATAYGDAPTRNKFNNGNLLGVIYQRAGIQNGLGTHTQHIRGIVQQVAPGQGGAPGTARFI